MLFSASQLANASSGVVAFRIYLAPVHAHVVVQGAGLLASRAWRRSRRVVRLLPLQLPRSRDAGAGLAVRAAFRWAHRAGVIVGRSVGGVRNCRPARGGGRLFEVGLAVRHKSTLSATRTASGDFDRRDLAEVQVRAELRALERTGLAATLGIAGETGLGKLARRSRAAPVPPRKRRTGATLPSRSRRSSARSTSVRSTSDLSLSVWASLLTAVSSSGVKYPSQSWCSFGRSVRAATSCLSEVLSV